MDDVAAGQVSADAAELYERFFVPALFEQWPARLLDLADVGQGERVLDVGCGTGVLARAALARVGPTGRVQGLDVNEGMLAVAARVEPRVDWVHGTAESLPQADESVDRVVSQFALMFVGDRGAAAEEMARVVRPGGSVCVASWAGLSDTPGYDAMVGLLADLFGDEPARALAAPFSLGSQADLLSALTPALDGLEVRRLEGIARFPSLEDWVATDVRAWTLAQLLDDDQFAQLQREARVRLRRFCDADGRVAFPAPALVAVARR